ncbi:MAG: restriction endonuclease, partial [Bacteroidia bacterium]
MLIDFKEIPQSNGTMPTQDIFEKFARDFFKSIGYEIELDPARGADGGIDIKVSELIDNKKFFWLVSCKHYAHTGKSITKKIETDINDRIVQEKCDGFIGFYSTIANASLSQALEKSKNKLPYKLFDN